MLHTTNPPVQRDIPDRINLALLVLLSSSVLMLYIGLPLLAPSSGWWILLASLSVIFTNTHWSLLHEAMHGLMHSNPRINHLCGRTLAVLLGAPFEAIRMGHLQHHRRNGTVFDRPEIFDPAVDTWRGYAPRYYFQLLIGLYVSELLSLVFVLLPKRAGLWALQQFAPGDDEEATSYRAYVEEKLYQPDALRRARVDALVAILLLSLSLFLYGGSWPMLAGSLLVRGFLLSFFDNSYHYGGELYQINAAYNAKTPGWWSKMLLHFNLHAVHHRHPNIPWIHLPKIFQEENDQYHDDHLRLLRQQLNGPISKNRIQ
jgi:fatty acid desaturase